MTTGGTGSGVARSQHAVLGRAEGGGESGVLSLVRLRQGLLAAVLVHAVVDVALFSAVARHALFSGQG